jgi:hypothetical protein
MNLVCSNFGETKNALLHTHAIMVGYCVTRIALERGTTKLKFILSGQIKRYFVFDTKSATVGNACELLLLPGHFINSV